MKVFFNHRRNVIIVTAIFLCLSQLFYGAAVRAETPSSQTGSTAKLENAATGNMEEKYSEYIEKQNGQPYAGEKIRYDNMKELSKDQAKIESFDGEEVVRIEQGGTVVFHIDVPKAGLYQVGINYLVDNQNILPAQAGMQVNGHYPFYELRNLVFESSWKTPDTIPKDKYGNEVVPEAEKIIKWEEKRIADSSYRTSDPFLIQLNSGNNEVSLEVLEGSILIKSFFLASPQQLPSYKKEKVSGSELILIEAENITNRNDSSIRAGAEYNVDVTPYKADKRVLNVIDSTAFKKAGQKVEYEFEVKKSGYYYLGMNYRQKAKVDFPVFVNITIDGEIPFKQFKNYPLQYSQDFKNSTMGDKDKKIPVYLDEGVHTIGLAISLDYVKPTMERVESMIKEIQNLSLEVTKLSGTNIDRNRDINIKQYMPNAEKDMLKLADDLNKLYENMKTYNKDVDDIGAFSSLTIAEKQLRSLAAETDKLHIRKNELATGTNSVTAYLGNLLQAINDNGLAIDKIYFYQDEKDIPKQKGMFVKAFEGVKRFVLSFSNQDYSVKNVNDEHLQVWVNRPRQYIEILQKLIDEEFTPQTGVKVDISLMPDQNKLILANASGEAPDVATALNYALPYDLAIRGALQDLTEFEDYDEVKDRFPQGLLVPGTTDDGVYALPETMNFWVLFYRKDILDSMQLPVPQTMQDVKSYLPELQRKGMNFFYPTAGMIGLKFFAGTTPIIYQHGGRFYGDTIGKTTLNEESAIEGMRELTELSTIYNTPFEVPSFYQQFRDGSLPIGISDYYMYNLILNAAPEIANSWEIALVPGVENNGDIERWSAGGAESNVIFKDSKMKEEAWEFLKWWSSKETQVAFGNSLQVTYGQEYIWNTATIKAFEDLPWITKHKTVILDQTKWLTEVPRVPGSYMLERELSNAYNTIVLDGENLRTAIDLASKRVNRETYRKLEEFGYMKNGEMIKAYQNPETKK